MNWTGTPQELCIWRLQPELPSRNTPDPPLRDTETFMFSPDAHSWTDDDCVVPGSAEISGTETPTGRCGTTSDQV